MLLNETLSVKLARIRAEVAYRQIKRMAFKLEEARRQHEIEMLKRFDPPPDKKPC
jgi:hypothetical protein